MQKYLFYLKVAIFAGLDYEKLFHGGHVIFYHSGFDPK